MQIPALNWIIEYFESHHIPYVVCGGLAAKAYGSTRELVDIDIYVPDEYFQEIVTMGKKYVTFGPAHYVDDKWDLTYVQFEFDRQKIEIGSDKACKIRDSETGRWYEKKIDFNGFEYRSMYGKCLKVMNRHDLISYKKKLNRAVDIDDIRQIQQRAFIDVYNPI